ncbi:MAG: hypothetical protein LBF28_02525 [Rickettsiales bacterium]|nr:hypothetical protein [Rickettsiales bacterium]
MDKNCVKEPDCHFVRQHRDGTWSERPAVGYSIRQLFGCEKPQTVFDFLPMLKNYTIFKGWYAVPNHGIQNGMDAALHQLHARVGFNKIAAEKIDMIKFNGMLGFYKRKNEILNNVASLEKLENDYSRLVKDAPYMKGIDCMQIQSLLEKFNPIKYPEAIHSPYRDLKIR